MAEDKKGSWESRHPSWPFPEPRAVFPSQPQPPHTGPATPEDEAVYEQIAERYNRDTEAPAARDEREAFEVWLGREAFTERSDSGKYVSAHVDAMWSAWQARAARAARAPQAAAEGLSPSEAVFAFAGWLTGRREAVTFSAVHDAAPAAELAGAFVDSQGFAQPRLDFHLRLKPYPAESDETPQAAPPSTFSPGDRVRKVKGSRWQGRIVGTYSTALTPEGYAVESDTETGSVQIYPAAALELVEPRVAAPQPTVQAAAVQGVSGSVEGDVRELRQMLADCEPYLKDGETPAQRIERERSDTHTALSLLAAEKRKVEALLSAPPVGEPVAHTALKQIQQHLRTTSYHPVKDRIFEIVDQYFDGAPSAPAGELASMPLAVEGEKR